MYEYYVEKAANETGEHFVHSASCSSLPEVDKLRFIGVRSNTQAPLNEASDFFTKVVACPECMAS